MHVSPSIFSHVSSLIVGAGTGSDLGRVCVDTGSSSTHQHIVITAATSTIHPIIVLFFIFFISFLFLPIGSF